MCLCTKAVCEPCIFVPCLHNFILQQSHWRTEPGEPSSPRKQKDWPQLNLLAMLQLYVRASPYHSVMSICTPCFFLVTAKWWEQLGSLHGSAIISFSQCSVLGLPIEHKAFEVLGAWNSADRELRYSPPKSSPSLNRRQNIHPTTYP